MTTPNTPSETAQSMAEIDENSNASTRAILFSKEELDLIESLMRHSDHLDGFRDSLDVNNSIHKKITGEDSRWYAKYREKADRDAKRIKVQTTLHWDYLEGEQKPRCEIWRTVTLDGIEYDLVLVSGEAFDCRDFPCEQPSPSYAVIYWRAERAGLERCPQGLAKAFQDEIHGQELKDNIIFASDPIKRDEELFLHEINRSSSLGFAYGDISYCICGRSTIWAFVKPRKQATAA